VKAPPPAGPAPTPLTGSLLYALALRFLRGRGSRLLSSTALAALAASTLGVMAMGVAMALMTGYRGDLQKKLVGANAAVLVYPPPVLDRDAGASRLSDSIRGLPEVTRVDRVAYVQGVMATGGREAEVTLRGAAADAGLLSAGTADLAPDADGISGVVLGVDLAHDLGVAPGDRLRLVVVAVGEGAPKFVYRTLRFAGTFTSGFAEFDREWAVAARETVVALAPQGMESLEVVVGDLDRAPAVAEAIRGLAPDGTLVTDWKELNRELFAALALQKAALFLLLGLIVLVSTFNVASSLVVLVRERRRDLGVLAALGRPPRPHPRPLRRPALRVGQTRQDVGGAFGAPPAGLESRDSRTSAEWEDCDVRNRFVPPAGTPIPEADAPGGSPAGRATRRALSCYRQSYATDCVWV
jgi:lipoprotein-releasing system permease protein